MLQRMPEDTSLWAQDNHNGRKFWSIERQSVFVMSHVISNPVSKINSSLGYLISKKKKKKVCVLLNISQKFKQQHSNFFLVGTMLKSGRHEWILPDSLELCSLADDPIFWSICVPFSKRVTMQRCECCGDDYITMHTVSEVSKTRCALSEY